MVNILLATYNGESFLDEQILSIINQSYIDWGLYVHDDGSTDRTLEMLEAYKRRYPDKITLLDSKDKFRSASKNFSYILTAVEDKYGYYMFCDQDDIWVKDKLQVLVDEIKKIERVSENVPVLLHSDLELIDENGNAVANSFLVEQGLTSKNKSLLDYITNNKVTGCTTIFNYNAKRVFFPYSCPSIMHDWWLACKVFQAGGKVVLIDRSLVRYRQHNNNVVGLTRKNLMYYFLRVKQFFFYIRRYKALAVCLGSEYPYFSIFFNKFLFIVGLKGK